MLNIHPQKETKKIVEFLQKKFREQKIKNAVIGLSGGIDSITSYYLLKKALPAKNIFPVHLPYDKPSPYIPKNIPVISIKKLVDELVNQLDLSSRIRIGNIMTRVRMIILFDLAKKYNALVCGTENKSEHLLGYFTRFGDGASDIEPIGHLYKTQVYQLAKYLGVPQTIMNQKPSAGLWSGQTDETEFGFTYEEADQVLFLHFDTKMSTEKIIKMGYKNAKKIMRHVKKNEFKRKTPYYV